MNWLEEAYKALGSAPMRLAAADPHAAALASVTETVPPTDWNSPEEPWSRVHTQLVHSGLWSRLRPCSRATYIALCALADRRKRTTLAGVERVARLAGISVSRTMFAYRELKDHGLIWRRRVALNGFQPYMTGLTNPSRWRTDTASRHKCQ